MNLEHNETDQTVALKHTRLDHNTDLEHNEINQSTALENNKPDQDMNSKHNSAFQTTTSPSRLSQTLLALTFLASTIGTYIACCPPNPNTKPALPNDTLSSLNLTGRYVTNITTSPLWLTSIYVSCLAFFYPNIPPRLLRYGRQNGLNTNLISWSAATSIPLLLILAVGVPLRLIPYASLGDDFTFALAQPNRLVTTGVYSYVQHPSYTGLVVLVYANVVLLGRTNGALACVVPPRWYPGVEWWCAKARQWVLSLLAPLMVMRVMEEERMLKARFGTEWEVWNAAVPRFIPWAF